MSQVLKIMEG